MKHSFLSMIFIISVALSNASSCENRGGQAPGQKTTENNINENTMSGKIKIKVNSHAFTATLPDNNSTKAFIKMLPMTPQQDTASLFPKGEKLGNKYFTGTAFLKPLLAKDKNNEFALGSVTFEPRARTIWHTHPKGQVLIVTEGEGFYQEKGKPAQALIKGDVVNVPENTEHWHGASVKSTFVHIAITNYKGDQNVVWLKPVTDEEYNEVNKK